MHFQPIDPEEFTEDMRDAIKHLETCDTGDAAKALNRQIAKFEEMVRMIEEQLAEYERGKPTEGDESLPGQNHT